MSASGDGITAGKRNDHLFYIHTLLSKSLVRIGTEIGLYSLLHGKEL